MSLQTLSLPQCFSPAVFQAPDAAAVSLLASSHLKSGAFDFLHDFTREVHGMNGMPNGSRVRWSRLAARGCSIGLSIGKKQEAVRIIALGGVMAPFSARKGVTGDVLLGAFVYLHDQAPRICGAFAKTSYNAPTQGKKGRPLKKQGRMARNNHQVWMTYAGASGELFRFEAGENVGTSERGIYPTRLVRDVQWLSACLWAARRNPIVHAIADELGWFAGRDVPTWSDLGSIANYVVSLDVAFDPWEPWNPVRNEII